MTNLANCDLSEAIDNILRFSNEDFDNYKADLIKQLTEVDNEQQDLLHYINLILLMYLRVIKLIKCFMTVDAVEEK